MSVAAVNVAFVRAKRPPDVRAERPDVKARRPRRADRLVPFLFIAPFLVSFLVFFAAPSVASIILSFFRYRGYGAARWIGWQNYASLLKSPDFWESLRNTAFYWAVPIVPLLAGSFLLAVLVRSKLTRWPGVVKPLFFVPQIMAPAAAALVWRVILSGNGVLNSILHTNVNWTSDPAAVRWSVVMLLVWRGFGWYFVVFLSGLTAVPDELLEAAEVDGASARQRIIHVIMPIMRPIFLFAIVIDTIGAIQLFTEPNLLVGAATSTVGAPPSAAPIMNQVIGNIVGGQFGLAAAVGWMIFIAGAVLSAIQFRLFRES